LHPPQQLPARLAGVDRLPAQQGEPHHAVQPAARVPRRLRVPVVQLQTEPAAAELIFLGAGWPPVLRALADHLVIDARDLAYATVCADPDQAIAHIAASQRGRARAAGQPRG
jgi:hypothetical protein